MVIDNRLITKRPCPTSGHSPFRALARWGAKRWEGGARDRLPPPLYAYDYNCLFAQIKDLHI